MNQRTSGINIGFVVFCAAVTGIGGFLFGYDTAVINGANTFLQQHFRLDPHRDALLIGLATAAAIIGCVPGAMSAGFISDKFGRRRVLFFCAILYAVSGILSAIPQSFPQFIAARLLSGIAIGVSSMICPVYIAEIAPPKWRGRLGTLFQLGIVLGIFITLFINGEIQSLGQSLGGREWNVVQGWRWMLAAEALPALLFIGLLIPIPESPKWLIQAGREREARKILDRIGGEGYADAEIAAVEEVLKQEEGTFAELFSKMWRLPLAIAVVLMIGSQLSGINVVMYYSTDIFLNAAGVGQVSGRVSDFKRGLKDAQAAAELPEGREQVAKAEAALMSNELQPKLDAAEVQRIAAALRAARAAPTSNDLHQAVAAAADLAQAGQSGAEITKIETEASQKAFACSVWIGLVNLLATFIAILFVDKAGRKPLLLVGNAIQVVGLATVGWLYYSGSQSAGLLLGFVMVYTAAFAIAMGPLPWVVCSEIFPAKLRGRAMSVATFCIWSGCLAVALSFPLLLGHIGPASAFWLYASCSAATFLFVLVFLPETKGRSLEEIEKSWHRAGG